MSPEKLTAIVGKSCSQVVCLCCKTRINRNTVNHREMYHQCGFPETTTLDSLTAATYSTHMRNLCHHASNALKEIDVTDELMVLRLVTRKSEAVVAPDHEFTLIVVMRRS